MATNKKIGRCPNCCPDGGACFEAVSEYIDGKLSPAWKCQNCNAVTRRVVRSRTSTSLTKSQAEVVKRLEADFGATVKHEIIGRKAFVTSFNESREWFKGQSLFGTIGPNGAHRIELQRLGGNAIITNQTEWNVYLK